MARAQQAPEGSPSIFLFPSSETTLSSVERAVLGALMLDPAGVPALAPLDVDDLAHPHHRALLLLMRRMHTAGLTWDPALILSTLEQDPNELEACGGSLAQISGYPDECPSIEILPSYMASIQDSAARRRLRALASKLSEDLHAATMDRRADLGAVVEDIKRRLHGALPYVVEISAEGPDDTVWRKLSLNKEHKPRASLSNIYTILRDDPRWADLRLNLLGANIERDGLAQKHEAQCTAETARWLATHYEVEAGAQVITSCLLAAAQGRAYHPVQEYLLGLQWDGVERIHTLRTAILGCPVDAEHHRLHDAYLQRFLIGAVARALKPGCKMDTALILVGAQGAFKSTLFAALFSQAWFGDSPIPIGEKDAFIQLRTVWCYESAEMEDLSKKTAEAIKQFLSGSTDVYRAPYDREARHHARHSVMVGTTNRPEFLTDETGSRRFWPITIPDQAVINVAAVREQRDQLWAEAVALYQRGDPWWLTREEEADLGRADDVARYQEEHPWTIEVRRFLDSAIGRQPFQSGDVFDFLKIDMIHRTKGNERVLGGILRSLSYESGRQPMPDGSKPRVWRKMAGAL